MAFLKSTELGIITISDEIILELLFEAEELPGCKGNLWISTSKGHVVTRDNLPGNTERRAMLKAKLNNENHIELSYFVVTRFGMSIKEFTREASDHIASRLKEYTGQDVAKITVNLAGVRSRKTSNIVRRNTKVVFDYA